jgi:hypothetical protein
MPEETLDMIGILQGTDKTSLSNDYLRHYERILAGFRGQQVELLEIGVAQGESLRTWADFMPHAKIVGVDNNEGCLAHASDRITVEIGSQADPVFLSNIAGKYQPSIIIDDGSHQAEHIMLTFQYLFPILRQGGVYIIEDLYLHHGQSARQYHRLGAPAPSERFSIVARRLAGRYADPECDVWDNYLASAIDRIEFMSRAVAVHKRCPTNPEQHLAYLWRSAEKANHAANWYHLSMILVNNLQFDQAEAAARRAVTMAPKVDGYWLRLADMQARAGHQAACVETLRASVQRFPTSEALKEWLIRHEAQLARTPG